MSAERDAVRVETTDMDDKSEASNWTVGVVAQTVSGEVVLRMTGAQAGHLRDSLIWLLEDDDQA